MSTFCAFETKYKLIRIDQSFWASSTTMPTVQEQNVRIIGISCRLLKCDPISLAVSDWGAPHGGTTSCTVRGLNKLAMLITRFTAQANAAAIGCTRDSMIFAPISFPNTQGVASPSGIRPA